jgi:hypothetical protein
MLGFGHIVEYPVDLVILLSLWDAVPVYKEMNILAASLCLHTKYSQPKDLAMVKLTVFHIYISQMTRKGNI